MFVGNYCRPLKLFFEEKAFLDFELPDVGVEAADEEATRCLLSFSLLCIVFRQLEGLKLINDMAPFYR